MLLVGIMMSLMCSTGIANAEWEACIGEPYGTAGCPVLPEIGANETIPPQCGDGIVNDDEECDLGRFNGFTNCTEACTILYCGDSVVSPYLGEECEPLTEEYYNLDADGAPIRDRRYIVNTCGAICEPPVCDDTGQCFGGCKRKFLPECTDEALVTVPSAILVTTVQSSSATAVPPAPATGTNATVIDLHQAASSQELEVQSSSESSQSTTFASIPTLPLTLLTTVQGTQMTVARCGNGNVEQGEECDDGNYANFDECPNTCELPICGDGIREGTEKCDDGNEDNSDYCNTDCMLTTCGDGITQKYEECDAGSKNSGTNPNTCRLDCRLPWCGDAVRDKDEECDDGNEDNEDSCTTYCDLAFCGDGYTQGEEECDEGNENSDKIPNVCRLDCKIPTCGDGIADKDEECDDGNDNDKDSCNQQCKNAFCGDDVVQEGEVCDDGNTINEDGCTSECKFPACGDGYLSQSNAPVLGQDAEECDDGEANSNEKPDACRINCKIASCGDRVVDTGEECDGGEDCTEDCKVKTLGLLISRNKATAGGIGLMVIAGTILPGLLYMGLRKKKKQLSLQETNKKDKKESLDSIPLSQFELPWHSWSK